MHATTPVVAVHGVVADAMGLAETVEEEIHVVPAQTSPLVRAAGNVAAPGVRVRSDASINFF
jgi:hypothetical protein